MLGLIPHDDPDSRRVSAIAQGRRLGTDNQRDRVRARLGVAAVGLHVKNPSGRQPERARAWERPDSLDCGTVGIPSSSGVGYEGIMRNSERDLMLARRLARPTQTCGMSEIEQSSCYGVIQLTLTSLNVNGYAVTDETE